MNYQHIDVTQSENVTLARIIDRKVVDEVGIHELGQELLQLVEGDTPQKLVVNFSQVSFLSSAALGRLLILHKKSRQNNTRICLSELQPAIEELFAVTRLNELFAIKQNDAVAIASLHD